jgi:hypothetical protein
MTTASGRARPRIAPFPLYEDDVLLSASWRLTRKHRASSEGIPVLLHTPTGAAFGPNDSVNAAQSYGGLQTASSFVVRLLKLLPSEQQQRARSFLTNDRWLLAPEVKKPRKQSLKRSLEPAVERE